MSHHIQIRPTAGGGKGRGTNGSRMPLKDLTASNQNSSNNLKHSRSGNQPLKPQAFTVYEDENASVSSSTQQQKNHVTRIRVNDENKPPRPPKMAARLGPPLRSVQNSRNNVPSSTATSSSSEAAAVVLQKSSSIASTSTSNSTARLPFVIHQDEPLFDEGPPQASSSPAFPALPKQIAPRKPLGTVQIEPPAKEDDDENFIEIDEDVEENLVPAIENIISRSSASDFRRNNDSISSTTTNEDELEEEDCDADDLDNNFALAEDVVIENDEGGLNSAVSQTTSLEGALAPKLQLQLEELNSVVFEVDEYSLDILKRLMDRETNFLPKWNYMTKQPDITFTMRSILIDWLVEVGEEYKLHTETMFLAVNYIDRFLSFMSVQRGKLQLVGTACMFIAAKYEEIYPPEVGEFCYITDDTYTKRQVLRMEQLVLNTLGFECTPPTAHFFVNHLSKLANCTSQSQALAQYLTELTLMDAESFLPFSPSIIGASAVALSRHTLGLAAWEDSMAEVTGYKTEDLRECLVRMHTSFSRAPELPQQAIREKYKNAKYYSVSDIKPTPIF